MGEEVCRPVKKFAESFYKSAAWQSCRDTAIRRDRFLCVDCLKQGRHSPAEEVHHIVPITPENINDPEITLNLSNLVSLCRECHKARHGNREPKRYKVDDFGRVTIR